MSGAKLGLSVAFLLTMGGLSTGPLLPALFLVVGVLRFLLGGGSLIWSNFRFFFEARTWASFFMLESVLRCRSVCSLCSSGVARHSVQQDSFSRF